MSISPSKVNTKYTAYWCSAHWDDFHSSLSFNDTLWSRLFYCSSLLTSEYSVWRKVLRYLFFSQFVIRNSKRGHKWMSGHVLEEGNKGIWITCSFNFPMPYLLLERDLMSIIYMGWLMASVHALPYDLVGQETSSPNYQVVSCDNFQFIGAVVASFKVFHITKQDVICKRGKDVTSKHS